MFSCASVCRRGWGGVGGVGWGGLSSRCVVHAARGKRQLRTTWNLPPYKHFLFSPSGSQQQVHVQKPLLRFLQFYCCINIYIYYNYKRPSHGGWWPARVADEGGNYQNLPAFGSWLLLIFHSRSYTSQPKGFSSWLSAAGLILTSYYLFKWLKHTDCAQIGTDSESAPARTCITSWRHPWVSRKSKWDTWDKKKKKKSC